MHNCHSLKWPSWPLPDDATATPPSDKTNEDVPLMMQCQHWMHSIPQGRRSAYNMWLCYQKSSHPLQLLGYHGTWVQDISLYVRNGLLDAVNSSCCWAELGTTQKHTKCHLLAATSDTTFKTTTMILCNTSYDPNISCCSKQVLLTSSQDSKGWIIEKYIGLNSRLGLDDMLTGLPPARSRVLSKQCLLLAVCYLVGGVQGFVWGCQH